MPALPLFAPARSAAVPAPPVHVEGEAYVLCLDCQATALLPYDFGFPRGRATVVVHDATYGVVDDGVALRFAHLVCPAGRLSVGQARGVGRVRVLANPLSGPHARVWPIASS